MSLKRFKVLKDFKYFKENESITANQIKPCMPRYRCAMGKNCIGTIDEICLLHLESNGWIEEISVDE